MKKIVLLTQDQKASTQTEQWLRDLPEEVGLEIFPNLESFAKAYWPPAKPPAKSLAQPQVRASGDPLGAAQGPPEHPLGHVHVLIADADDIGRDPLVKLREARKRLGERGAIDPKRPLSILAMSYEPAAGSGAPDVVRQFRDECVDDLVLKPLDRSLFLQKVEMLLADDPATAAPTFLFKQKTSLMVEMGKETSIERIGESGFAIRNPTRLMDGLYARAYSSLFGDGEEGRLYGRVYANEPHPEHPGEYLTYFSFFGATHAQLTRVRKFAKAQAGFRARGAGALASKGHGGKKAPATLPSGFVHVAVIDVDPFASAQLAEALESNFINVRTHRFPSYSAFLAQAIAQGAAAAAATPASTPAEVPAAAAPADVPVFQDGREQAFVVLASTLDVIETSPLLRAGETAFGATSEALQDRPGDWLAAFPGAEGENLREFASVVAGGRSAGRAARVTLPGGGYAFVEIRGRREKTADGEGEARLRFEMKEIDEAAYQRLAPSATSDLGGVQAIFIDGGLIPTEPQAWYTGLREVLNTAGLVPAGGPALPVIVIGDEGATTAGPARFRVPEIRDFINRPLDRRLVVEKAALAIPALALKDDAPHVEFHACAAPGKVAKDVEIEEFSEYGAMIKHRDPLRDDAFMALFGEALSSAGHEAVWARCTHCAKAPGAGADDGYHCFFRFIGITDETLKRIRAWIREDYVAKKEGAA